MGSTSAQRQTKKAQDKALLEAAWEARDRSEVGELRALVADLMGQLDLANAAAVRMAQTSRPAVLEMTAITGERRLVRA